MSIVDKIAKLRKKAEDKSLSEEEAALFAEKVAELMAEHGLEQKDIPDREGVTEWHWHTVYCNPWRQRIARATARLYFCDIYFRHWYDTESRKIREGIVFVGRPEYIFIAKEISEYLWSTTMRLARDYGKSNESRFYTRRHVILSFERGMGERLAQRLRQKRDEKILQEGGSLLPVLYRGEDDEIKKFKDKLGLVPHRGGRMSKLDNKHAMVGIRAADEVSLEEQVTQQTSIPTLGVRDPGDPE